MPTNVSASSSPPAAPDRLMLSSPIVITGLRLAGAGAGFLAQLLVARLLGAAELGVFYAVTSLAAVAGLVVAQGYPAIMIRFVARYRAAPSLFLAFLYAASLRTAAGVALACGLILFAAVIYPFEAGTTRWALVLAAVSIPFVALINLGSGVAAAKRRFDIAYVPETLVRPMLFLAAAATIAVFDASRSGVFFIGVYVAITAAVALGQFPLVRRLVPHGTPARVSARLSRRWRNEAYAAIIAALFLTAFADVAIVLSSPLMERSDTAVFGLCLKLSFLVGFLVQIAHHVASPDLAEARIDRDAAAMHNALRRAVIFPTLVTLILTVSAALAGNLALGVFGPDFVRGGPVLVVLIAAQAVCALAGPSVTMMTLSGAQRQNAALCGAALTALVVTNVILVPPFGALGAATAVFITMSVWLISVAIALYRRGEGRTDIAALMRGPAVLPDATLRPNSRTGA